MAPKDVAPVSPFCSLLRDLIPYTPTFYLSKLQRSTTLDGTPLYSDLCIISVVGTPTTLSVLLLASERRDYVHVTVDSKIRIVCPPFG